MANKKSEARIKKWEELYSLAEKSYTAESVKKVAGVSKRRLVDWDRKKILPRQKRSKYGWRFFSEFDLIYLKLVSALRDTGVPIGKLGKMYNALKNEKRLGDLIRESISQDLYFCTSLRNDFRILQRNELGQQLYELSEKPIIILRINPLVAEVQKKLNIKVEKPSESRGLNKVIKLKSFEKI